MSSIRPSCEGDPHEGEPLRADRVVNRPLKASSLTLAFSLIWISIAWYLVNLAWQNPDQSMPHYMAEGGPLQNLQLWLLGSSLFVGCLGIWKHRGEERGVFVFLIGLCFYLFWREADWDKDYVSAWLGKEGVRMFSWRYLVAGSEFPLRLKVVLGTTSIAIVAAWLIYCWHYRSSLRAFRAVVTAPMTAFWLAMTVFWLFLAQLPDRGWLMAKPETALKDIFIEEAPELLGELSFLFFMLMVWEGLKYGARSDSRDHPAKPAGITT